MDDIDLANKHAEMLIGIQVQVRKPVGPPATGFCLWCEERLADQTHRWCDRDCCSDWELATKNAPHLIP